MSPQPCEEGASLPNPTSEIDKTPIPRTTGTGRIGRWGQGTQDLGAWTSTQATHPPPTQESSFSDLASHPGWDGRGWPDWGVVVRKDHLQKAEPEGVIRGRGQEEAASTAFPGKGPLCGQRQSGSQPSTGQARTNQAGSPQRPRQPETPSAGYPPVHQQSPTWAQPHANLHSYQVPPRVSLLLVVVVLVL